MHLNNIIWYIACSNTPPNFFLLMYKPVRQLLFIDHFSCGATSGKCGCSLVTKSIRLGGTCCNLVVTSFLQVSQKPANQRPNKDHIMRSMLLTWQNSKSSYHLVSQNAPELPVLKFGQLLLTISPLLNHELLEVPMLLNMAYFTSSEPL